MVKDKDMWEKVGSKFAPFLNFIKVGDQITGTFVETRESPSKRWKSKTNHFHEVDVTADNMKLPPGKYTVVGGGQLDYLIKAAEFSKGDGLRITYGGKAKPGKKFKKGMEPHQFILEKERA